MNISFNRKRILEVSIILIFALSWSGIQAQDTNSAEPEFLQYTHSQWVDSLMAKMTLDEKVGQLLFARAHSNLGEDHIKHVKQLITEHKIGGLVFFQGDPKTQLELMNTYQELSDVPLLGAIDGEWGLGMRLEGTISYPFQMALGAVQDKDLIYRMGKEIGRQVKRTGLDFNFAPDADINNNPNNPVINARSFGENKKEVAARAIAYTKGMQEAGILTSAKHFPGHGDTDVDSHFGLPLLNFSKERLDTLELYPFKQLIEAGISGVMVGHLNIPALDSSGTPSTLSKPIITDLLKEKLEFKGLVVTDAMEMKGVTKGHPAGVADRAAALAGVDILELSEDTEKAVHEIKKAVQEGALPMEELDTKVRKILAAKQWVGLNHYRPQDSDRILKDLNTPEARFLNRELVEASLTLIQNKDKILPLKHLDTLKIASLSIGTEHETKFQKSVARYTQIDAYQLPNEASATQTDSVKQALTDYNLILLGIHDDSRLPQNKIDFSDPVRDFLKTLNPKNVIVTYFKNPYSLDKLPELQEAQAIVMAYQDSKLTEDLSGQLIFGGIGAKGRLPVTINENFKFGDGVDSKGGIRLKYTLPEEVGMNSDFLIRKVDSLVNQALDVKATPGAQVLLAKDGKVILNKAYGLHRYSDTIKVKREDLYDMASVTKVSSALPALMQLADAGKFDVDQYLGDYMPYFKNSNKDHIPFRDILTHQAGFEPYIVYWQNTLRKNGSYKWNTFKPDSSKRYPIKITNNIWLHRNYKKKIYKAIKKSPVSATKKYKYSGLVFILLPEMVERISGEPYQTYIRKHLYDKLGANHMTYNPEHKFPLQQIVPTEDDYLFRHLPVHGTVHDEAAAVMGGVSANAGIFANANDMAKLMQMYLNNGEYGGERFIDAATVKEWTKTQFLENDNHRGIGFDKPMLGERDENWNTAIDASPKSFGHTGFTGTMVWADPENNTLFIFLSNRVSPTRNNSRIYQLNTRTNIQEVIYESLKEGGKD